MREIRAVVDRVAAVREALGPDRDLAVDFHGRVSPALARVLCQELEPLRPLFVEEPVVPELVAELSRICASTTVPIATGERLYSRWDFRKALDSGVALSLSHRGRCALAKEHDCLTLIARACDQVHVALRYCHAA